VVGGGKRYDDERGDAMTITLELPPEVEARLAAQAKARGLSLNAFLRTIITIQAAAMGSVESAELLPREGDLDRAIDELFDTVQVPPGDGEGALRRENWYR
jgi:HicB family